MINTWGNGMSNKLLAQAVTHPRNAIAVAVSIAVGANAQAQQLQIEEIVVTATKRSESLQEVPVQVTAFTTGDIERNRFKGIDDYAKQIPDLAYARREPAGTSVVFRGVAASGIQFGTNPSASVYLDEQPVTNAGQNPNPRLIDIERLEALSGPQGTLFGDASQSGTLRIITNKPDASQMDGWVEGGVSNVQDGDTGYDFSAMVNIPLAQEQLAIRLVGFYEEEAGFINNIASDAPDDFYGQPGGFDNSANVRDNVNTAKYTGGRGALRWTPGDATTVDLSAVFQSMDLGGFGDNEFDLGGRDQVRFRDEKLTEDWYQVGLSLEQNFSAGTALIAAGYFNRDLRYEADATAYQFAFQNSSDYFETYYNTANGTAYDLYFYDFRPVGQVVGGGPRGFATEDSESDRYSIEARFTTADDGSSRWRGIVGAFYQHSENHTIFESGADGFGDSKAFAYLAYNVYNPSINGLPPGSWSASNNWFWGTYDQKIDQFAVFGEATFDLTDNFSITAGGRWYDVERSNAVALGALKQGASPNVDTDYITFDDVGKEPDTGFVPKLNATWRFAEGRMLWATYSEGFRSGGANALRPSSVLPRKFDTDTVQNFEIGAKTSWMDNRVQLNVVAYRMKWDNIQVQVNDPQPLIFGLGIVNFPEAEIDGVEGSLVWIPAANWQIYGNFAYTDATISKDAVLFDDIPGAVPLMAAKGTQLPITPDWKGGLGVEYVVPTNWFGGEPYIRFDYVYVGDSVNALEGLEATVSGGEALKQDSYSIGDLKFGLEAERWSTMLYVNNVSDESGNQFINNRWIKSRTSVTRPRTIGVNFRWRYGK